MKEQIEEIFAKIDLFIAKYKLEPNYLFQHLEHDLAELKKEIHRGSKMTSCKDCLMDIVIELEVLKGDWGKTFTAEGIQFAIDIVEKHLEDKQ